jgi:TPR repeat protein
VARAGAAERFWAELRALYEAAGEPTLERLVRLGREQSPKIDISDSTIDDWLNGISVPAKHLRYFDVLVAFLQPMAERRSGYSPQSAGWWQGLLREAREERAAARGAGRPRAGGRRPGRSPGGAGVLAQNDWQSAVLLGPAGELPRVADIGLLELGVHPTISAVKSAPCQDQADEMPDYVPRDRDADIEAAVKRGGLVVVTGRSAAGKSRAAAEAMRRAAGGRHLLVPRDGTAVRALAESGQPLRDAVIWLDDLEHYVKDPGLDIHVLNRLCPQGRTDITVLATLRPDAARSPLTPVMSRSDPAKILTRLLEMATTIRLPFETSGTERERAMRYEQDLRIARWLADDSGAGLPEYLAAGPAAVRRWMDGRDGEHLVGAALISAAVDCRRAHHDKPVSHALLAELYRHYLDPRDVSRSGLPDLADGFRWATVPVHGASACLSEHADSHYRSFDYLVDYAERYPGTAPIPVEAWRVILRHADEDEVAAVVTAAERACVETDQPVLLDLALDRLGQQGGFDATVELVAATYTFVLGSLDGFIRWVRPFAESGHSGAMAVLGDGLVDSGQAEEGERWLRRAAEAGDQDAVQGVAELLYRRADTAALEEWLGGELAGGNTDAIVRFASFRYQRDEQDSDAELWFRRAADSGHPQAMAVVGAIARKHGDADEARQWSLKAAEHGDLAAMVDLGCVHATAGETDEAERWFGMAAEAGEPMGLFNLAILRFEQGRGNEGEALLRSALAAGCSAAVPALAMRLYDGGDSAGLDDLLFSALEGDHPEAVTDFATALVHREQRSDAERWYREAAEAGVMGAMNGLGNLLMDRAGSAAAKPWYLRAAQFGDLNAKLNLTWLHRLAGERDEAESWARDAARNGSAIGMYYLGVLLAEQNSDEADQWFRQAAEHGNVDAMYNLASSLALQGKTAEARQWFARAAARGDEDAARQLRDLER